ncbi:MAG TPA: site-specific DNA-methyltransferase, partial [Candidatus Marinimicrobia bacterium]|nr:site-specific DNA-methyltransferase [Candidatus Neomarinimicrobiota bacterium]
MSKMQEVKHNPTDRIIVGDSRQLLTQFSDNTFLMCVTSPPYWG